MPYRNKVEVFVRFGLFDLTHPEIDDAYADLKTLIQKVGSHLTAKGIKNFDNTLGILKIIYYPEDHAQLVDWFQNRSWKDAVLQSTDWDNRDLIDDYIDFNSEWTGG